MADNVDITAGSGTTVAADELTINATSVKVQRIKLVFGADGAYDGDVDDAQPLPTVFGHRLTRPGNLTFTKLTALATSGDNAVIAASGAQVIRIYAFMLKVKGAVDVKWRDSVAASDLCPIMNFTAAGDGIIQDYMGFPYFISAASAALKLNLSAAVEVNGWVLTSQE